MRLSKIYAILTFILVSTCLHCGKASEADLVVTLHINESRIFVNMPVEVEVCVSNTSSGVISVLPVRCGSRNVEDEWYGTLELVVVFNKVEYRSRYLKLWFGPIKEIESLRPPEPVRLGAGQKICNRFILGGKWFWEEKYNDSLFDKPGSYEVRLIYYPFIKEENGRWNIDKSRFVKSDKVMIDVTDTGDKDRECWEAIRKVPIWYLIYDPELRCVRYIRPPSLRTEIAESFRVLAEKYSDSIYRDLLLYTSAGLQIVMDEKQVAEKKEAIEVLRRLANEDKFIYRVYARQLLESKSLSSGMSR